jgi:hypothetical protein
MLLHCTQKLAAKLPDVSATPLVESSPLGSWHANFYTIDRRQCVMFCHDESRYVIFLPGLVKADFADLGRPHRELFLATLIALGVKDSLTSRVALALGPMHFDCLTDRSVLGSLRVANNDLDGLLDGDTNVMECDPLALSLRLNRRPVTVMGKWSFPDRVMLERIERLYGTTAGK